LTEITTFVTTEVCSKAFVKLQHRTAEDPTVPLNSSKKKRKKRLQLARAHENWTVEDWKNVAWSDKSRFLLRHSDGRVNRMRT